MIVVSDTSVISNLAQVDCIFILKSLYQEIIIPVKVQEELLRDTSTAEKIQNLDWITVRGISDMELYNEVVQNLDPGEAEAIVLAKELVLCQANSGTLGAGGFLWLARRSNQNLAVAK